jgi:hypothetical protein
MDHVLENKLVNRWQFVSLSWTRLLHLTNLSTWIVRYRFSPFVSFSSSLTVCVGSKWEQNLLGRGRAWSWANAIVMERLGSPLGSWFSSSPSTLRENNLISIFHALLPCVNFIIHEDGFVLGMGVNHGFVIFFWCVRRGMRAKIVAWRWCDLTWRDLGTGHEQRTRRKIGIWSAIYQNLNKCGSCHITL